MNRLPILLALLLLCTPLLAQEDQHADQFRELYTTLSSTYARNPDDVANLIELAHYYSHPDSPQRNLVAAASHLARAEELYTAWLQDRSRYRDLQKLIKKGITLTLIRQQRQSVAEQAQQYVAAHAPAMETNEREAYLKAFADNPAITKPLLGAQLRDTYRQALAENTIDGYYQFILANPGSSLADSAQAALSLLADRYFSAFSSQSAIDSAAARYPASSAMQRAALSQKSSLAFYAACQANTQQAYADYLERFPRGDDYLDALARLQALQNMDYGLLRTPLDYANFAQQHADSPLADSALATLRRMVTLQHNQQAANLYLQRFPLDEHYSDIYKEYYSWFSADGNRQPIADFADDNPHYPYLMTVRSDLARSAVIDSFNLLRPFVEADYQLLTDCIHLCMGRKAAFVALQRILQNQIAHREWSQALLRMQQFAICFEDLNNREYTELAALLSDSGPTRRSPLYARANMHRLFPSPDGSRLYFTLSSHPGQQHGTIGYARKTSKGKTPWAYAGTVTIQGASGPVTAFGFYDGGTRVLLGIDDDIWSAQVVNDSLWTSLQRFEHPVNTLFVETDACMLPDGSGMLLASDRPDGINVQESGAYFHGDTALATDLYFIPWVDGKWGPAVNLGLPVNSPYCERSPLLSRNMKTLYFVTDARGLGYGDVYMTSRADMGSWTQWSEPVNLGRDLNGSFDEAFIAFADHERQLLLTSNSPHGTSYAAFSAPTHHDTAQAYRTVQLSLAPVAGVVRGIDIVDADSRRTVHHLDGPNLDTLQSFRLYKGKFYVALITASWLYVPAMPIAPAAQAPMVPQAYTLDQLRQLESPLPLRLVQFYAGTAHLQPAASDELDRIVHFMQQHAACSVTVATHCPGTNDRQSYNLSLSRAQAVRNYLSAHGIDPTRVAIAPYGNSQFKQGLSPVQAEVSFR